MHFLDQLHEIAGDLILRKRVFDLPKFSYILVRLVQQNILMNKFYRFTLTQSQAIYGPFIFNFCGSLGFEDSTITE
jgi:hypothetical protein